MFTFDGDRELSTSDCSHCGRTYERVVGFILRDGNAYAIYRAALHRHEGLAETWLDITFDDDWFREGGLNRTTFGCRLGPFGADGDTHASLVLAGMAYPPDTSSFGLRLSREGALAHTRLPDLWALVDWLVGNDPEIARHIQP